MDEIYVQMSNYNLIRVNTDALGLKIKKLHKSLLNNMIDYIFTTSVQLVCFNL